LKASPTVIPYAGYYGAATGSKGSQQNQFSCEGIIKLAPNKAIVVKDGFEVEFLLMRLS